MFATVYSLCLVSMLLSVSRSWWRSPSVKRRCMILYGAGKSRLTDWLTGHGRASVLLLLQMFVRLFVDENLDRVSPISKQPKDKIQAILEACDRQFPEFHVRSRKRIRTYLKSCRRLRRCKDLPDSPQVIDQFSSSYSLVNL